MWLAIYCTYKKDWDIEEMFFLQKHRHFMTNLVNTLLCYLVYKTKIWRNRLSNHMEKKSTLVAGESIYISMSTVFTVLNILMHIWLHKCLAPRSHLLILSITPVYPFPFNFWKYSFLFHNAVSIVNCKKNITK